MQLNTLEDFFKYCPGHVKIEFLNEKKSDFNYISIVFPWALELFESLHYFELDGSFRAMKPFSFCIAQGIVFNESIPIAISIAPTKCEILYNHIFDHIKSISNEINFIEKVVLSDMHIAIKSICKKYCLIQYFCHRYLIEHFGANCVLGFLCKKILKTYSAEEYNRKCIEIKDLLNDYKEERIKQKIYTKDFENKVKDLETMISGDNGDFKSNYFYINWALWIRSSCRNLF